MKLAGMLIDVVGGADLTWAPAVPARYVAVVGSRRRDSEADREQVLHACMRVLEREMAANTPVVFVSGGCWKGADRAVELVVEAADLTLVRFLPAPTPNDAPHYVRTCALFDRNTRIVMLAHEVLAQVAPDRTGGTEDAVKKAHRLGRPVTLLLSDGTCALEHPPVSRRRRKVIHTAQEA